MIHRKLPLLSFLLVLASVPLHALAAPKAIATAPTFDGPTQIEFDTKAVSKWTDLPMGTYRVPNSDVIISGHQKGGAAPMLLFGVIGMAVQNSVNAGNGKEAMAAAEQALTFSIDEEAKAKLLELVADPAYASRLTAEVTADRKFEVTGAVVLSYANQREVLPYVTLRVKLMGKGGKSKLWTTRYIASAGARKPLVGEGSWTAENGAPLRTQVTALLDTAIRTMLKDIAAPYVRDEASLVTVKGFFPHVNKPLQVVGYKLGEENGQMVFLPKLGTSIVFAGVNVLDTGSVLHAPTVKGDAPLKLLKPDQVSLPDQATAIAAAPVATEGEAEAAAELPPQTDADAVEEAGQAETESSGA
jgi:hypothetical protein